MFSLRTILAAILVFSLGTATAQVLNHIDVRLRVMERVVDKTQPLPNAKLTISDQGDIITDSEGRYNFTYPVRHNVDPEISIVLQSDEHKVLKPLDGSIELDSTRDEIYIEFLVVNMVEESPEFKKRVQDLEQRIGRLRSQNQLTKQQLNQLNETLLDTIMYFENNRRALEQEITNLENLTDEQRNQIRSQNQKIEQLEQQVDDLTSQLSAALEERYLRQNQYFRDISSSLLSYLNEAKDLRDHLPYMSTYFGAGGYADFDKDIREYNKVYEEINKNHPSYIEGVERYWEEPGMSKEIEDIYEHLIKSIHLNQILTVMGGVRSELAKQKPRKAQKIANESLEDLTINIQAFEQDVNKTLRKLRKSL